MVKSRIALIGVGVLLCGLLTACGSDSKGGTNADGSVTGTLRIFSYADAFTPDVFDAFTKANPDLTVEKSEIASDEGAVAKLKGGFKTDVVNTCAGPIDDEVANHSLQPIDTSRIKDWDQIYPFFTNFKGVKSGGKTYMLPLIGGAYGLVYRPSAFPTPPTSWMDLFTTNKRVTSPDDPLTNIVTAALALGYFPPQSMTKDQLNNVQNLLIKQKKHVVTYYQGAGAALASLWKNDEVDITPLDISLVNQLKGQDIAFAPMSIPLAYACGFSIAKDAKNLDAVYAYLNYALSPAVQRVQAKSYSYLVSNKLAVAGLPAAVLAKTGQKNIGSYAKAATYGRANDQAAWTTLWQNVKGS